MESKIGMKALLVVAVATGINFMAGLLYIWSILSKGLMTQLHWTSSQASLPYTVATISFVTTMALLGKIQDTRGPRVSATLGGLLIAVGLVLSGMTTDPGMMIITFGVITGAGVGLATVSTISTALKWFPPHKKGLVSGIVLSGVAVSSIAYSPLVNYLIMKVGISKSFIFLGIIIGVLLIGLAQFLKNPPSEYVFESANSALDAGTGRKQAVQDLNWKGLLKSSDFYKLWITFAFASTTGLMIYGHAANIAKVQVNWEGGYWLVILLALFNFVGRLSGGALSDRIGRINLLRITLVIQAVNMLFFHTYQTMPLLLGGIALAGLGYGATFVIFPAATAEMYGMKNYGGNYGLVSTAWGMGGVIGPMTAARILDTQGNYHGAYVAACILLLLALMVTFSLARPGSKKG